MEEKASKVIEENLEKYLLVNAIVKRSKQLRAGDLPRVSTHNLERYEQIAMEEFREDKFKFIMNEELDKEKFQARACEI